VCFVTCSFGGACANDAHGAQQRCQFTNLRITSSGAPSGDAFAGLVCVPVTAANLPPDAACRFYNDCQDGWECDLGNSNECKKLCRNGMAGDCAMGKMCKNEFKLATFGSGDIGLCL
jgi:hypothetical protein